MTSSRPWMVVRVRTQYTARAITNMERQEFECYNPCALIRRGKHLINQALFPGYVFARHSGAQWMSLTGTFGVLGVVMGTGSRPAELPHAEIEKIRAREGPDGLIRLAAHAFHVGDHVHVNKGAWDLDAIVDGTAGHERIYVLMQMLGRWTRAEVDVEDVRNA